MNQRRTARPAPELPFWVAGAVAASTFIDLTGIAYLVPALGRMRPAFLLLGASILGLALNTKAWRPEDMQNSRYWRVIGLVVAVAVIGIPFAVVSMNAVNFLKDHYIKVLIQALILWAVMRQPKYRDMMLLTIIASAVFSMVMAVGTPNNGGRLYSFYYDANSLALLANFTLPMLGWLLWSRRDWWRWIAIPVAPLCLLTLVLASSRGGFIACAMMGLTTFMLMTKNAPTQLRRLFPAVIVLGILGLPFTPQSVVDRMNSVIDGSDYNFSEDTGRIELWKRGLGYGFRNPILGVGIFNYWAAEGESELAQLYLEQGRGFARNVAHSLYIEAIAELGLIAGGAFCWLMFITIWDLFMRSRKTRQSRDPDGIYAGTLAIAMVGFAVSVTFLSYAYYPTVYMMYGLCYGLLDSLERGPRGGRPGPAPRRRGRGPARRYPQPMPQPQAPIMRRDARA